MIQSAPMLINGLRTEATKTYLDALNRQSNSNLAMVMDLDGFAATNRDHTLAYRLAAPHIKHWPRGDSISTEGMDAVSYDVEAHNWGVRLEWHEDDRTDDQTQSLMQDAAAAGASAGLLAERFFFDLLLGTTTTLPVTYTAPDGLGFFSTSTRFETSGGNTVASFTASTTQACISGYFDALKKFQDFKDGKGQPLWSRDVVDRGVVIIVPTADEKVWTEALKQKIQLNTAGVSNVILDDNRNVTLWPTSRISTNEAYIFLKETPIKPTAMLNRQALRRRDSMTSNNNGDSTRATNKEYIQWDLRAGAFVNLPYGAIKLA